MKLENELQAALRRKEPPPGFADRVLARVPSAPVGRPRRTWVRWFAAMAASLLLAGGGLEYRHYQRGERAKAEVLLAVRIAASKLNQAQKKVLMLHAAHRSNS
jgi:hypothetical protein